MKGCQRVRPLRASYYKAHSLLSECIPCYLTHGLDLPISHNILPTRLDVPTRQSKTINVLKRPALSFKFAPHLRSEIPFEPANRRSVAIRPNFDILQQETSPKARGDILSHFFFYQRGGCGLGLLKGPASISRVLGMLCESATPARSLTSRWEICPFV